MGAGGIVLCGGESRRMGRPKAWLPFGPELMLQRVVRLVGQAVRPVVVVASPGQVIPELPCGVSVLHDQHPDRGPLEGLAVGLRALADRVDAAFVTGCDVPLLLPAYVRRLVELRDGYDVVVPHPAGFDEPLSAVYSVGVLRQVEALLAAGRLRPAFLFDLARTRRVEPGELIDVDPALQSLRNVNTPAEYQAALGQAGLAGPTNGIAC